MIPNLYVENGCFTKHPFIHGCLGIQVLDVTVVLFGIFLGGGSKYFSEGVWMFRA